MNSMLCFNLICGRMGLVRLKYNWVDVGQTGCKFESFSVTMLDMG